MRWLATSGIMATSEPVRARMAPLTRSMSAETRSTRGSIEGSCGLPNRRITATELSPQGPRDHRNAMVMLQVYYAASRVQVGRRLGRQPAGHAMDVAAKGSNVKQPKSRPEEGPRD